MKSCCLLKGVIVVLVFCVQVPAFAQSDALPAKSSEQPVTPGSDSLQPRAAFHLLSFTGSNSNSQNTLTWKTGSRSSFSNFTLERSADEKIFATIEDVGVTTSSKINTYTYVDGKPVTGRNFYRLRMTDSSGAIFYSAVLSINNIPVSHLQIQYEAGSGMVAISGAAGGNTYQLKLYNCNGQLLLQKAVSYDQPSISISQLAHGLYVVYATDGTAAPVSRKIIW